MTLFTILPINQWLSTQTIVTTSTEIQYIQPETCNHATGSVTTYKIRINKIQKSTL